MRVVVVPHDRCSNVEAVTAVARGRAVCKHGRSPRDNSVVLLGIRVDGDVARADGKIGCLVGCGWVK